MLQARPLPVRILQLHPPLNRALRPRRLVPCNRLLHIIQTGARAKGVEHSLVPLFLGHFVGRVGAAVVVGELLVDTHADEAVGLVEGDSALGRLDEEAFRNVEHAEGDGSHGGKVPMGG